MRVQLFLSILFVSFLSATSSYADSLKDTFEKLRDSGENYFTQGTVCEQVTRLEFEAHYPADSFHVDTGISYADQRRVIGELDVVVFRRSDKQVVLIAEVKCWKDLRDALKKAREQRVRFQQTIASGKPLRFSSKRYRYQDFKLADSARLISVSQAGGERAGFDMGLEFTLDELLKLRQWLLQCQAAGKCKLPDISS